MATEQEVADDPDHYRCTDCHWAARWAHLWPDNQEAWTIYKRLTVRIVRDASVHGWYLQHLTAGWPSSDVVDLVQRLDVIQSVLHPERTPDGGTRTRPEDHD